MNIRDKSGNSFMYVFALCFLIFGVGSFFYDMIKQGQHDFGHGPELRSYPPGHELAGQTYYTEAETGTFTGVMTCFMFVFLCIIIPIIWKMFCIIIDGICGVGR